MLTVLSVAYPLARVGWDAVGGAEQVLAALDAALVGTGHRSLVVACEGSQVAGHLVAVPRVSGPFDMHAVRTAQRRHRRAIGEALQRWRCDLVHMHGLDFAAYLPAEGVPVLATLHCPPHWYSQAALRTARPGTYLNAVSWRQHETLAPNRRLLEPIENGVPVGAFTGRHSKRSFALMLSRIAPEKGVHVALAAAKRADIPLVVAGQLFPYPEHERYFAREIGPRLDRLRRFVGPVGFARKRRLLGAARCLVVGSQVPETSSLVAREAMAAGTPVVALRHGALVDTVEHGRTGFLVGDEQELADAMLRAGEIDSEHCRQVARHRFDAANMTRRYLRTYEQLVERHSHRPAVLTAGAA
jgi:hypothetical protein